MMDDDDDGTSRTHPQLPLPSPQQISFCFPKLTKMTKRSRSDLNDDGGDALRHVVASTTATSKVDDTQSQLHQEVIAPPPPTKKLFSIFHFQKTKQRQKERPLPFSSSSFKTQPQPQVRNHSTTTTRSTSSTNTTTDVARMQRNIFVDLDGVLVDFDYGVQQLEQIYDKSKNPKKPSKFHLWSTIQRTKYFYRTLPWTKDGKELWSFLVSLRSSSSFCSNTTTTMLPPPLPQPSSIQLHILTGVPWNCHAAAALDKFHWCQRELQWSNDRTSTTTSAAAAVAVMALPPSILPSSVSSVSRSTTSSTTVSATPTTNHQNETAAVIAIVAVPNNVSKNTSPMRSIPATTTTTTTKSNVQWHWRNMAGPRNTHQHINEVVPTTVATDHGSGDEYRPSVITCWSIHKHLECCRRTNSGGDGGGDILIDDRPLNHQLQQKWEAAGGIFIHHTSTRSTIRQLQRILGQESHFV